MTNTVALVVQLLRAAGISNVYAELPNGISRPVARIEEAGGGPQPSSLMPDRMTIADLQVTVWGETKPAAWDLVSSIASTLRAGPRADPVQSAGTLVRVETLGPVYLPDEDWTANGRPGPRYEMTVRIRAHG